jgi:spore coat protein H
MTDLRAAKRGPGAALVRASYRLTAWLLAASGLAACAEAPSEPSPVTKPSKAGTGADAGASNGGSGGVVANEGGGGTGTVAVAVPDPLSIEERCQKLDSELSAARPVGWGVTSHCKEAAPSYERVFGAEIKRLDLVISKETHDAMQQDLVELMDSPGAGGLEPGVGSCDGLEPEAPCTDEFSGEPGVCKEMFDGPRCYVAPPSSETQPCAGRAEADACTARGQPGHCFSDGVTLFCVADPGPGPDPDSCAQQTVGTSCALGRTGTQGACAESGRLQTCQGPLDLVEPPPTPLDAAVAFWPRDPKYFDAAVRFEGNEWTHVGYRYKGNNGLATADENKRPFRLELDELEQEYPETTDQRLYGFKELSFSPGGAVDPTYLRQVLTSEMFARAGVPTPRSTLVSVYLDKGDGPELLGLYAMTEVPGDPLTQRLFDDKNGALYKPDGLGAHLLEYHRESFHEKSDGCPPDQGDVQRLIDAINANTTDRNAWRQRLAQALDLPAVVRFFAANQANGNWDTYGGLAHNYYLYGETDGGPLHFIPWDFDLSLDAASFSDFTLLGYSGEWPLIQAIARDAELYSAYHVALEEVARREYDEGLLARRVTEVSAQLRPLLTAEGADVSDFDDAIDQLQYDLQGARDSLREYLDSRGFVGAKYEP